MAALREQGHTLDEIALRFEVSRERVRQLLGPKPGPGADQLADLRRRRADQQAHDRVDELLGLWRAGRTHADAATALGLRPAAARRVIAQSATDADRAARKASFARARVPTNTYSDADIIRALRRVTAHLGRTPRAKEYTALHAQLGGPSLPTILNRMDGWTTALRAAGVAPPTAAPRPRRRRWTVDACWTALHRVVAELGTIPTVARYDHHARDRDDLPSSATVRNRLGRWSTITSRLDRERSARHARSA